MPDKLCLMRVLLISRYGPLVKPLARGLTEEGYTVEVAADGDAGEHPARAAAFDVIILDLPGPRESGLSVLRRLRGAGLKTPALVLAAPDVVADQAPGAGAGPDSWLTKPFELEELFARLRALARRPP
jgi:DNA-binding response OmpR family regulator